MQAKLITHVLKFWRSGPKRRKMEAKKLGVFLKDTVNLFFFVAEQIGMKFWQKHQSVSSVEN